MGAGWVSVGCVGVAGVGVAARCLAGMVAVTPQDKQA